MKKTIEKKIITFAVTLSMLAVMPLAGLGQDSTAYAATEEVTASDNLISNPAEENTVKAVSITGKTTKNSKSGLYEMKASLKKADIEAALKIAAKNKNTGRQNPLLFSITSASESKADKTVITISKTLLKKIRKECKASLRIDTYIGSVTLDRNLMKSLIDKAKGKNIEIVTEKVEVAEQNKSLFGKEAIGRKIYFRSGGKSISNPKSNGAKAEFYLYGLNDTSAIDAVGRLIPGGKLLKVNYAAETDEAGTLRFSVSGSLLGTYIIGTKEKNETARIITGVRTSAITAKVTKEEKASEGRLSRISLSWTKTGGFNVDGYEIYDSYNAISFQKAYTLEGNSCFNRNVESGTTKYYKVRGYREINGQIYYTRWSNVISGKV